MICCWMPFEVFDENMFITMDCVSLWSTGLLQQPSTELIIFKPLSVLDAEITLFSFPCSGLLSSDYVEIHYENGKPQHSKVQLRTFGNPVA